MLELQKYLLFGKSLIDLKNEFAISSKIKNNKVSFNYDQLNSPMKEKICQECRGIILRENSWEIIAYPFDKFFNYGEGLAANINWESAKFSEKIDGSLLILYFDSIMDRWFFATRSMPEGDGTCVIGLTYSEIAFLALKDMGIIFKEFEKKLNRNYTYMFEMVSPYTQVFIFYPENKLYLIGARNNISCNELDKNVISKIIGIDATKEFSFNSINDCINNVDSFKGTEQEGIVVCDMFFNRIKIKNIAYGIGQRLVHSLAHSDKNILQIILLEQDDDIMPHCQQFIQDKFISFKEKLNNLSKQIEKDWRELKDIPDMKQFALSINSKKWKSILFLLKRNKILSVKEYFDKCAKTDSGTEYILNLI